MSKVVQLQELLLRSRRLPWLVLGITLAILAGTILLAGYQLRQSIRREIVRRDAEVLYAVALMLQQEVAEEMAGVTPPDDPINQSVVLLKTSRLGGVLAARLFDGVGRFVETFPPDVRDGALDSASLRSMQAPTARCCGSGFVRRVLIAPKYVSIPAAMLLSWPIWTWMKAPLATLPSTQARTGHCFGKTAVAPGMRMARLSWTPPEM